jgi:penicillin-binding protein 1B
LVKREIAQHLDAEQQTEGMRVFTTFSVYSQQLLEQTVAEQLVLLSKKPAHSLQAAMVVTEINSGEIKALVGGKQSGYAGFNRALNAKRPIGSLIKPAIYLAALERYEQFQLASILADQAIKIVEDNGKVWQPNNYDGQYRGQVTLIDALVYSLNIPTVNLGMTVGLDNVADAMHLLGYPEDIVLLPSMLLGALNMSPYQVNQFYLPIANQGQHVQGHVIDKVVSAQGETLWQFSAVNTAYFSQQASFLLDYALSKVTEEGTAKSLTWRLKNKSLAGKTGTTNDQRDSWFVGYDGQHLVTTWLGRDDNKPTDFTGSSGALVLFSDFMKKQGVTNKETPLPPGVGDVSFEQSTGFANQIVCSSNQTYPAIMDGLSYVNSCSQEKQTVSEKKISWFKNLFSR